MSFVSECGDVMRAVWSGACVRYACNAMRAYQRPQYVPRSLAPNHAVMSFAQAGPPQPCGKKKRGNKIEVCERAE